MTEATISSNQTGGECRFDTSLAERIRLNLQRFRFTREDRNGLKHAAVAFTLVRCSAAAEIGNIKREVAFHGDVINTAARIQGICNKYNQQLLISGELLDRIGPLNGFQATSIGEVQLKGKKEKLAVYAIAGA